MINQLSVVSIGLIMVNVGMLTGYLSENITWLGSMDSFLDSIFDTTFIA